MDEAKRLRARVPCVSTFMPLGPWIPAQGELTGGGGEGREVQSSWQKCSNYKWSVRLSDVTFEDSRGREGDVRG